MTSPPRSQPDIVDRLRAHMGKADIGDVLIDCRKAADIIEQYRADQQRDEALINELRTQCVMLTEEERHAVGHARYQVEHATPENPDCCFDYGLVQDLLRIIDRATSPLSSAEPPPTENTDDFSQKPICKYCGAHIFFPCNRQQQADHCELPPGTVVSSTEHS